jgi:hypothetical protein
VEQYPQKQQFPYMQNSQFSHQQSPQFSHQQSPQFPSTQNPQSQYLQPQNGQQQAYSQNLPPQNRSPYQYNFTEKQMRRYFYKPAVIFMWLAAAGALTFLLGLSTPTGAVGIVGGLVFLAVGGIPLAIHYTQRPNDEQYAEWVAERSKLLYPTAVQRLHILDETKCTSIAEVQGAISSYLQGTKKFPEKEIVVKRLPNGLRHCSINVCTYIFLAQNRIAIYSGYVNALTQSERFEDADNYNYKDIVGISTSGPVYMIGDGSPETQRQGFFVRINNGDVIGTDYATKVILRSGGDSEDGVDRVVAGLLKDLRQHNLSQVDAIKTANTVF